MCRLPILFGTAHSHGTYTLDSYPSVVFYDVSTCIMEPPSSPTAILAAAARPDAECIMLCATRPADLCGCGTPKLADTIECVCCVIARADVQETEEPADAEPEEPEEQEDDEDYGICTNCFRTFEGEGFHGFCGPVCAAVRGNTICHCCYE